MGLPAATLPQNLHLCRVQVPSGLIKQYLRTQQRTLSYYVPDPVRMHRQWQQQNTDIPYWSQVWPSALALAQHIDAYPALFRERTVLELGAGIGLPSLAAAAYARHICCSDHIADALPYMELNAAHQGCAAFRSRCIDWTNTAELPNAEVLLLSDVAYDPQQFLSLERLLRKYLFQKTTILLSLPQRRVSAGFLDVLPEPPVTTTHYIIDHTSGPVAVQVLLLQ